MVEYITCNVFKIKLLKWLVHHFAEENNEEVLNGFSLSFS